MTTPTTPTPPATPPPPTPMTWPQVCARRPGRHGLSARWPVVRRRSVSAVAGTHAQVRSAAWAVHLPPAAELPAWTAAPSAAPMTARSTPEPIRMTCDQVEHVLAAVEDAVRDAEPTVDELSVAVVAAAGSWAGDPVMEAFGGKGPRWRQALPLAGMRGLVCFGPNRGRKTTCTAPPADPVAWLLRRYLHAFGPSTPARFANLLNVPGAWVRRVFESADLSPVVVDGGTAWVSAGDTAAPGEPPGGLWHRERSGRRVVLTVEPFFRTTEARRRELGEQVDRVAVILGATPVPTIGEVTVGGHAWPVDNRPAMSVLTSRLAA